MWHVWETERCIRVFQGGPEGKRSLGRPGHKREDNIKMILKEARSEAWIGLIWLRTGTGGGVF